MIGFDPISLFSGAYMLVAATGGACPAQGPVDVDVRLAQADNAYVNNLSAQQLTKTYMTDPDSTLSTDGKWMVSGVTVVSGDGLKSNIKAEFKTQTNYTNDTTCFSVSKVEYEIQYSPTIYIASDYKNMGCRYSATLAHEKRHVAQDVRTFTDYVPVFTSQIKSYVEAMPAQGPYGNGDIPTAQHAVLKQISDAMTPTWEQLLTVRRQRQAQIDTLQNYMRDTALCPGQFPKFDGMP